ncbi:MAG: hypothetical protein GXO32_01255 [Crenarchaeota archaeon]|nr:hypothetical protein [Thermoproteota archaeon]
MAERKLEIEYKLFKKKSHLAAFIIGIILYGLVYLTYAINRPTMIGGLSLPFLYSLVLWAAIIVLVIVSAARIWR